MRFRILGPLEVEVDGTPVAVGGGKPRTLLAALLVHRGAVVSTDRLVEAVWGDSPPQGATGALRAYVSRLRLGLDAKDRLRYRPPGYALAVDDDELDAAEFERLVALAQEGAGASTRPPRSHSSRTCSSLPGPSTRRPLTRSGSRATTSRSWRCGPPDLARIGDASFPIGQFPK